MMVLLEMVEKERHESAVLFLVTQTTLPGVLAYGGNSVEAIAKAQALALRVLADRLEHGVTFCPSHSYTSDAEMLKELGGAVQTGIYVAYGAVLE